MSILAVNYNFSEPGVVINGVAPNSPAEQSGIKFDSIANLRNLEVILRVNDIDVNDFEHFFEIIETLEKNSSHIIYTDKNKNGYSIFFSDSNQSFLESTGISVREEPKSNIRLGIELEGGSRLILEPQEQMSSLDFDLLANTLQSRIDVYGASGTSISKVEDTFSDDKFIIVESPSSNVNDILELIRRDGVFEAKLGNETVFTGDNVLRVFNDPGRSRLESCSDESQGGIVCRYSFQIEIDTQGADQFLEVAKDLPIVAGALSEPISFILDGEPMENLSVASSFKYQRVTNPSITVSGDPMPTRDQAIENAAQEMKFLQTILSTQSLNVDLEVVQSYTVSSTAGEELLSNSLIVGIVAMLSVALIIAIRYRNTGIFIGIMIALAAEVIILLGVSAFMRLTIDLAAIGGIIASIGTGVDDNIIITDERFRKKEKKISSKRRMKNALAIVLVAYVTTVVAMIPLSPLIPNGLKLLQGFAFMIIIGVTIGVFITRPAYAVMLRIMTTTRKERNQEDKDDED